MATVQLTEQNFSEVVENNPTVLLDFWAPWCLTCTAFTAVLAASSEHHPGTVFATINTDEQQNLAGAAGITSVPTLLVIKDHRLVHTQHGALSPAALEALLRELAELDG
ncbi:MAG: thioredoxin domain-containing protein [Propionibacterium sp.]